MADLQRDWLLVTVHTPGRETSAERVYAWRKLRGLGALYLHQSVCVLPAREQTRSAIDTLIEHLRSRGAQGEVHVIKFTDEAQETALIDEFQAERSDEYGEVVERTKQFHEELEYERGRGRVTYPEFEESETDLVRHQKWLAAIEARDYFDAPRPPRRSRRWTPASGRLRRSRRPRWRPSSTRSPSVPSGQAHRDCVPSTAAAEDYSTGAPVAVRGGQGLS